MDNEKSNALGSNTGGVLIVVLGIALVALPLLALVVGLDQLGYIDARHFAGRPVYWRV